jgi:transposase-like protein
MSYSSDFRRKVLSVRVRDGLTIAEVAHRFSVGIASVVRWLKQPEPQRTRIKPATKIDRIALARDVREHPDAYLHERAARFGVSIQGIAHALRRMNITHKKSLAPSKGRHRRTAHFRAEDHDL